MSESAAGASDRAKGPPFVKLYDAGFDRLDKLLTLKGGPTVSRLWVFLNKHADHHNALAVTVEMLAEVLGVHERSVRRAARVLEDQKALVIAKLGNANVYILNPGDSWRTAEDHKRFCGFSAKALVGFKENPGLRARLSHFMPQRELFPGDGAA